MPDSPNLLDHATLKATISGLLKGSMKPPTSRDLELLRIYLDDMRSTVKMLREPMAEMDRQHEEATGAVESLYRILPQVLQRREAAREKWIDMAFMQEPAHRKALEILAADKEVLEAALDAIEKIRDRKHIFSTGSAQNIFSTWHGLAGPLAYQFRKAMKRANPGVNLGNSNAGPVARFVSAVLPYVSGDDPKPATVSAYLKSPSSQ